MDIWLLVFTLSIFGKTFPVTDTDAYYTTKSMCQEIADRRMADWKKEPEAGNTVLDVTKAYCKKMHISIPK